MLYKNYRQSQLATFLKRRRYRRIIDTLGIPSGASILEVGCGVGIDFLRFALNEGYHCHGLDNVARDHLVSFPFTHAPAEDMPFSDKQFDAVVSIGVLEHVNPKTLPTVAAEIQRVGRKYCVIVPSLSTIFEPHVKRLRWPIRPHTRKQRYENLYYYSDEVWLQLFPSNIVRYWYAPFISNVMLYN